MALVSILSACGLMTSEAAFLTPTAVVYVSTGTGTKDAIIDNANLSDPPSPTSTQDASAGKWTGVGSIKQEIVLDLGQSYSLDRKSTRLNSSH